jgi:hypothetical protein
MINYFYNKYFKYQISPVVVKNFYVLETTPMLFTKIISQDKQFFNVKLLFYSMLSFYIWIHFIAEKQLALLLVVENTYINILKLLFTVHNFSFISENAWIPGILSNSHVVWNGKRYKFNFEEKNIFIKNIPDFIYLCSTKYLLVSKETNSQLIPQFAILSSITTALSVYLIPLFIPKWDKKYYKLNFTEDTQKNNNVSKILYYKRHCLHMEKYITIKRLNKISSQLIYISFLLLI